MSESQRRRQVEKAMRKFGTAATAAALTAGDKPQPSRRAKRRGVRKSVLQDEITRRNG